MTLLRAAVLLASVVAVTADGFIRVCYYSNAAQYRPAPAKLLPDKIDPHICTHLIYAFAKVDENSELNFTEYNDGNLVRGFNGLKKSNPKLVTLLAVGGYNQGATSLSKMADDPNLRSNFARKAVDFIQKWGFDGLSLDWQFTSGTRAERFKNRRNFVQLLNELRQAMESSKEKLLLSAAVPWNKVDIDSGYDVRNMVKYLDFISLMSYDIHGPWEKNAEHNSPLFAREDEIEEDGQKNVEWAVSYWVSKGVPNEKLIIGLPTYGRSFTLARPSNSEIGAPIRSAGTMGPFTKENGFLAYYEICKTLQDGATRYLDDEHKVPHLVSGDQWISYDDKDSFTDKLEYIKTNSFGGAMVWEIGLDDFNNICGSGNYPLMKVIREELGTSDNEDEDQSPSDQTQRPPQTTRPTPAPPQTARPTPAPPQTTRPTPAQPQTERPTQAPPQTTRPAQTDAPTSKQTPQEICKQNRFGYFEHPDSCSKFIICNHYNPVIRPCAPGTYWDQKIKNCNHMWAVDCKVKRVLSMNESETEKALIETLLRKLQNKMSDADAENAESSGTLTSGLIQN